MALSGSVSTSKYTTEYGNMYYIFEWAAQQNVQENKTYVEWTLMTAGTMKGYIAERT